MSAERGCEEIRDLLPELALGVAEGEERGILLEHLADCPRCRQRLAELAEVADEILLLAPTRRASRGLRDPRPRRVQPRAHPPPPVPLRLLIPAAAAAVAVAATMVFAYRGDRDLADRYRGTLAEANGRYLSAEKLSAPGGEDVGVAFGYEGSPSWVLVTVEQADMSAGPYQVELVTRSGQRIPLRPLEVEGGAGSLGQSIPFHFDKVAEVRLLARPAATSTRPASTQADPSGPPRLEGLSEEGHHRLQEGIGVRRRDQRVEVALLGVGVDQRRLASGRPGALDQPPGSAQDTAVGQLGLDRVDRDVDLAAVGEAQAKQLRHGVAAELVGAVGVDGQPLGEVPLDPVRGLLAEGVRDPGDRGDAAVDPVPGGTRGRQATGIDVNQPEVRGRGVAVEGVAEQRPSVTSSGGLNCAGKSEKF